MSRNSRATLNANGLYAMQPKTLQAITAMITGLGIPIGTDPDILIRTYSIAVNGIREDAVTETCGRFIRGEVEGFKRGRCPTTDVFTQECRAWAKTIEAREWRAQHKKLADHSEERRQEHSFEHRQKMFGLLTHLKNALNGNKESQKVLAQYGWKSAPEKGGGR